MKRCTEINDEWIVNLDNKTFYNTNTGEIIENPKKQIEIIEEEEKRHVADKAKLKTIKKEIGNQNHHEKYCFEWKNKSNFNKVYKNELKQYNKYIRLSPNAITIIYYLQNYIEFTTNKAIKDNKQNFSNEDIAKLTGLSKPTIQRALKELEEKQIIRRRGKTSSREIYFNPYLISSGNIVEKDTIKMFQNYFQQGA